jgi:hypothetical protein
MNDDASARDVYLPVPRADVEWVDVDGSAVLHDPAAEVVHRLNSAATEVWEACDGSRSVADIVRALQRAHPDAGDVLGRDVRELVETFRRLHLLAECPQQERQP